MHIIDIYYDYQQNTIIKWIKDKNKNRFIREKYFPKIYASCPIDIPLIKSLPGIENVFYEEKKTLFGKYEKVLAIELQNIYSTASILENKYNLYNVDIDPVRQYILENNIFPFTNFEDKQNDIDYEMPELKIINLSIHQKSKILSFDNPIEKIFIDNILIENYEDDEEQIIVDLNDKISKLDPDVIFTKRGDKFDLPYLNYRTSLYNIELKLNRDDIYNHEKIDSNNKGKSYFSYGRIIYKPRPYLLNGRLHIDKSTFLYREGGFLGLIDLSRVTGIPLQKLCRLSPGSAITAIQTNQALKENILVPWKRNLAEQWKTAEELLIADRGALVIEPKVGIHENVFEVDFASLFPNIMVNHNISPETILCDCCPGSSMKVPFIKYNICEKRIGLIPRILKPLIERRMEYKKRIKIYENESDKTKEYEMKQNVLKWLLVTSFGYMGFNKARFGRIECHEAITAYARDILLTTKEIAEDMGFNIIHGIVDSLWIKGTNPERLCEIVTDKIKIPLEIKGKFNWIVFLPNKLNHSGSLNKYYGVMSNNKLKIRGVETRRSDTPILIKKMQNAMIKKLAEADSEKEFYLKIPETINILRDFTNIVYNGECNIEDLIFETNISKNCEEYKQFNNQVAALKQFQQEGVEINPGQNVRYIITDHKSKDFRKRVIIPELVTERIQYDKVKYYEHLLRATETILLPFGYSLGRLDEIIKRKSQTNLSKYEMQTS